MIDSIRLNAARDERISNNYGDHVRFGGGGATEELVSFASNSPLSASAAATVAVQSMKNGALTKLDTQLAALYYKNSSQAVAMSAFTSTIQQYSNAVSADGKYVLVDATAKDGNGAGLLNQLQALGIRGGSSFGAMASGWVPTASLGQLAATANLAIAKESIFTTSTGSVDTQADQAEAADTARTTYGVTGAGLRVGVLSDSFNKVSPNGDNMAADIASDDLPADTQILQDDLSSGGEDEGRAMAQLVHDIAPGASIDFASAFNGEASFASNIVALAAAGDKIIVDDVNYGDELSYQNGVIAQAVNQVEAQGVSYFSAAGNNGTEGYEGAWVAGSALTYGGVNYTLMNFAPGQDYLTISNFTSGNISLQWDSPAASAGGPGSANDLDFFIADDQGNILLASTTNNIGGDPFEGFGLEGGGGGTYRLYVGLASGAAPGDIRVLAQGNGLTLDLSDPASNTNDGTLVGHAAASGAIAVGAASFASTPWAGVNPPVSEYYSSGGVDNILYDDDGNRLTTADVSHVSLTAVDGGNTTFFTSDSSQDADSLPNFYGTSAAAPDAAAVAALMLEANAALTPTDIRYLLQDSAIAMANSAISGAGLIQADKAVGFASTQSIANSDQATLNGTHLNDTITGSDAGNVLNGYAGDDTLVGGAGADTFDGGAGMDTMTGGGGDDVYYVDDAGDKVVELANGGNDTINASVNYNLLGQYVETLTLTGTDNINATGNSQANVLNGNDGNNILDGKAGADTMAGGKGDDIYYVDNSGDKVIEAAGGGNDKIYSSVSYNLLGQYVETLSLTGTGDISATGNSQANTLNGNSGNNVLNGAAGADTMAGGAGNDTYFVDNIGDKVIEAANGGNDTINSSVSYGLVGQYVEILNLTGTGNINATGNSQANALNGNSGNNVLNGAGGADTMTGGDGDDTYYVDNVGDKVIELAGGSVKGSGGNDIVYSSVSYNIVGQYIETLTLTGTGDTNASGNSQANTLNGNGANNVIDGKAGDDVLTGKGGDDTFRFDTALGTSNIDTITDFTVGDDMIQLDRSIFTAIAKGGLAASAFETGTDATNANTRIIYDAATGDLFYDADGNGAGQKVQFATLSANLALTNSSFTAA